MHGFDAFARRRHSIELGHIERRTCDGVYISCYTDDRKRIAAVGRELDFKALVIKFGVFVGGARLEQADEIKGKAMVTISRQAIPGTCSNQ